MNNKNILTAKAAAFNRSVELFTIDSTTVRLAKDFINHAFKALKIKDETIQKQSERIKELTDLLKNKKVNYEPSSVAQAKEALTIAIQNEITNLLELKEKINE